jgi:hypothetical protein
MADILSLNVFRVVTVAAAGTVSTVADTTGYDFVGMQKDAVAIGTAATLNGSFDASTPVPIIDSTGTAVGFTGMTSVTAQTVILQQVKEVRAMSRMSITMGSTQTNGATLLMGLRYIT